MLKANPMNPTMTNLMETISRSHPELKNLRNQESELEKALQERIERRPFLKKLQEDLQWDNNTGLSTGAVSTYIMSGFTPMLVSQNIMKVIIDSLDGLSEMKIPYSTNLTAGEVADDGTLAIQSSVDYSSSDVSLSIYGVYNAVTWELLKHSLPDIVAYELNKMGYALGEKADELMFTAFDTAAPVGGANSNYQGLGFNTFVELDDVWNVITTMLDARLRPRIVITDPTTWTRLMRSSEIALPVSNEVETQRPWSFMIGGVRFIASHNCGADELYVIDPDETGYFLRDPISSFTYRESGGLIEDLWAYLRMGVTICRETSIYRIKGDVEAYPADV